MVRHTLVLFQDFQTKKREGLRKKIEETKAALPVTPFANAIVQTLKQHKILLIAGDTGCGKSTQGKLIQESINFVWLMSNPLQSSTDLDECWVQ